MAVPQLETVQAFGNVCAIRGKPFVLTPQVEDIDFLQHIRRPAKFTNDPDVLIILNVEGLKQEEVELTLKPSNILELKVVQQDRPDRRNVVFSRSLQYEWYLPQKVSPTSLQAQWTADNYLIIMARKSGSSVQESLDQELLLIPQKTSKILRPTVDLSAMKDIIEDIRDKSQHALRFVRKRIGDDEDSTTYLDEPGDKPDKPDDKVHEADDKQPADGPSNT